MVRKISSLSFSEREAVHDNNTVMENETAQSTDLSVETKDKKKSLSNDQPLVNDNNLTAEALPDITNTDIQTMINVSSG